MKRTLILILSVFCFMGVVNAEELTKSAKSAILIEETTGKVLYEYNADEALAPASMTKMMTLLLTMEAVENGSVKLDDMVTVSGNAASMGGSQVFLEANTQYKLEEILKAVCIASGNDAAVVLAETIGGSEANFVNLMNKRAKELGLTATNFVNAYGLDADGHLSSARDMATIARELLKHEKILEFSSIYEEYLQKPDGSSTWMVNTNKLVRFYQGVDGLKTGFTDKAMYCITATGKWNGMRVVSVVMGEPSHDARTEDTVALLNYGKSAYKLNTILNKDKVMGNIKIELGKKESTDVYLTDDITDLIKTGDEVGSYKYEVVLDKIKAPIKSRTKAGIVKIYLNGNYEYSKDLIVKEDIDKCSYLNVIGRLFRTMLTNN